jgi:hypothetical protein
MYVVPVVLKFIPKKFFVPPHGFSNGSKKRFLNLVKAPKIGVFTNKVLFIFQFRKEALQTIKETNLIQLKF